MMSGEERGGGMNTAENTHLIRKYYWPPVLLVWIQLLCSRLINNSFGQIQTSQTGGQPYSDTSPYEVSDLQRQIPTCPT